MAKQSVNIGTRANDGTGDPLRTAFDKLNDNVNEIYALLGDGSDLNISGDVTISAGVITIGSDKVNEANLDVTNSPTDGYVLTYDSGTGGFTWEEKFDGDITSIVAGDGLTGSSLDSGDSTLNVVGGDGITANADEIEVTVDDSTIELSASDGSGSIRVKADGIDSDHIAAGAIDTEHIAADQVTPAKLSGAYTGVQTITTTSGTINLDASTYAVFRLTSDLTGATTLNIQNMTDGQVIDITVSGSQTITFTSDDTTETFNKVGGVDYDGAEDNQITVMCLEDSDSGAIYNYTIGTYTSDTTP